MCATKPRLLVLTPDYPPARGGIQLLVHRLVAGMGGFETRVVALDCLGAPAFDLDSDLAVRRVRLARRLGPARNVPLNVVALVQALRFRPQLTLSAHIVTSPAAAAIRRALGARTIQYFHAKEIPRRPRLAAFAAEQAHVAVAVSDYTAGLIAATGACTATRLIPPGVDLPARRESAAGPRAPTIVTIARLEDRYKGHDVMIRALPLVRAQVPGVRWIVIGDGRLRGELVALTRSVGVAGSVRFTGSISDEERDAWLRRADLMAMPSRLPEDGSAGEGFGIVYLEAGAHERPVIAGNVAGALDAVADGENGLLVDPTDPRAVADAILRVLLDSKLARRLGAGGACRARSHAWPVIAGRVEALLLEQLPDRP